MKFRKKPVVIDAVRWTGENRLELETLVTNQEIPFFHDGEALRVKTEEGIMRANVGDWIIKGVKGELYPCKPDIFEATYEPAGLGGAAYCDVEGCAMQLLPHTHRS